MESVGTGGPAIARVFAGGRRVGTCLFVTSALLAACTSQGLARRASGIESPYRGPPDQVTHAFDRRLLGTNVPAWLLPDWSRTRDFASSLSVGHHDVAPTGGKLSNHYDWLGCELGDPQRCYWTWALRPRTS